MPSQNVYDSKNIKTLDFKKVTKPVDPFEPVVHSIMTDKEKFKALKNKINEVVVDVNKIGKDFSLYKKAYQRLKLEFDASITKR